MDAEVARRMPASREVISARVGVSDDRQWLVMKLRYVTGLDEIVAIPAMRAPRFFEALVEALRRLHPAPMSQSEMKPALDNQPDMLPADWDSPIGGVPFLHIFANGAALVLTAHDGEHAFRLRSPVIAQILHYRDGTIAALDTQTAPADGRFQ